MKLMVGQPRHIGKCLAIPLRDLPPEEARNMKVDTGEGKVCLTVRAMGFGNRQSPMHAHTNRDSGRSPAHFPSPNFQSPHRTSGQVWLRVRVRACACACACPRQGLAAFTAPGLQLQWRTFVGGGSRTSALKCCRRAKRSAAQ